MFIGEEVGSLEPGRKYGGGWVLLLGVAGSLDGAQVGFDMRWMEAIVGRSRDCRR